ncbi:hypothetical protein [Leptospira brenneri]|uniref:Uncharacterized protein n=1 Tax=Leptospira brenneri TaxID=2023182 RepID=A0A2M9Y006_9LEPT|nr:hypothetical protein [Leptospira brenneri]PJZ44918.1 hypothetical protein CH361_11730 [Leptospira brenneri]TGK95283.1 hypothetical protein EHQ30_01165 [Leptospira brenneri]
MFFVLFSKFTRHLSKFGIQIGLLVLSFVLGSGCDSLGKDCSKAKDNEIVCLYSVYAAYPSCLKTEYRTNYQMPSNPSTYTITTRDFTCETTRSLLLQNCRDQKKKQCGG